MDSKRCVRKRIDSTVCTGVVGRRAKPRVDKRKRKRKRNPAGKFYVFVKRDRTRFYYDVLGSFTIMGQPRGFASVDEARSEFAGSQERRRLYVTNQRPPHAKR